MAYVVTADVGKSLHEQALAGDGRAFEAVIGPLVESAMRLAYAFSLASRTAIARLRAELPKEDL